MKMELIFLDYSSRKLQQLSARIVDCLGLLSDEQIWARRGDQSNAIGNLTLHLCGNVRQWIGFGVGNLDDIRDRDSEFSAEGGVSGAELAARLTAVVTEAVRIIESVPAEKLATKVKIQKYEITVLEAIYHVVEHFSGHTGQIIFATKLLTTSSLDYYAHLSGETHHEQTP